MNNFLMLGTTYFGITLQEWLVAIGLFFGLVIVFAIVQRVLIVRFVHMSKKTESKWDDTLAVAFSSVRPSMYYIVAFLIAVQTLDLPDIVHAVGIVIFALVGTHYAVQIVGIGAAHLAQQVTASDDDGYNTRGAMSLMTSILKLLIWMGSVLFIVSNFGIDVTSLIAGLGIGGIAVALALQGILKDLFSSFSIFFDKPFTIGDFIEVGDKSGTVQKIGIKTTRLKALSGEEIIVPNQDLTSAYVRNFKRMEERRVVQKIGVTYETPQEKLAQITGMIEKIIDGTDGVRFSRAHFRSFEDWALSFEIVYFVESRDYRQYMDAREVINFGILRVFAEHEIAMAYPTQMVYHKGKES